MSKNTSASLSSPAAGLSSRTVVQSPSSIEFNSVSFDRPFAMMSLCVLQRAFDFAAVFDSNTQNFAQLVSSGTVEEAFVGGVGSLLYTVTREYFHHVLQCRDEKQLVAVTQTVVRRCVESLLSTHIPVLLALPTLNSAQNSARLALPEATAKAVEYATAITPEGVRSFLAPHLFSFFRSSITHKLLDTLTTSHLLFVRDTAIGLWSLLCVSSGRDATFWNTRWTPLHVLACSTRLTTHRGATRFSAPPPAQVSTPAEEQSSCFAARPSIVPTLTDIIDSDQDAERYEEPYDD